MNRRQFLANVGMGAVASGPVLRAQTGQSATDTPDEIYQRTYAIDAMCFAAAPPRTYVQYLTDEKIAALRTSGAHSDALEDLLTRADCLPEGQEAGEELERGFTSLARRVTQRDRG